VRDNVERSPTGGSNGQLGAYTPFAAVIVHDFLLHESQ